MSDDGRVFGLLAEDTAWSAFAAVAAIAAAMAARKATETLWSRLGSGDVPKDPSHPTTTWGQAIGWAVVAGATAGVARVVARRGAAAAWTHMTGDDELPA